MATEVVTRLIDDLTGKEAHQTVTYALDGVTYEIDLSDENAARLRNLLNRYIVKSRRVREPRVRRRGRARAARPSEDLRAVRAWAKEQGIQISSRGRIPAHVLDQYRAAHAG